MLVIGLVAMFNYFTRVADGTGIEADYGSELPRFVYRGVTESVPRPEPAEWPDVDHSLELLSLVPPVEQAWHRWQDYIVESPGLLPTATLNRLRAIAARNSCDSAVAFDQADAGENLPGSADALVAFADKLSRTPWLMGSADVDALRSTGMEDLSILHVIAVVAYQSAESRLRMGLSALARSAD